jgi:hypothetical protein
MRLRSRRSAQLNGDALARNSAAGLIKLYSLWYRQIANAPSKKSENDTDALTCLFPFA